MKGPSSRPASLPVWRKCVYAVLVVVLFFALLELLLTAIGVRPIRDREDPFVGFTGQAPLFLPERDENGTPILRTARSKLPWFNEQQFPGQKPPGTLRIFCLGGSTTQGQPYDDAVAFPGWLRELLHEGASSQWEVINAGGISYASYRVTVLMEELSAYEPDLFIIYTGHNEFLEERTYSGMRRRLPLLAPLSPIVMRSRTAAVMDRLLQRDAEGRAELPAEVDALLDRSVGPEDYRRDDALRRQVLDHFEFNLHRMADVAERAGAGVLFVVPAASLKDCSPFKSEHRDGLTDAEQTQFHWLFERGRVRFEEGEFEEALSLFRQAERIDDRYAVLHDRLSRTLMKLGRFEEARESALRAIDEDVCPLRAVSEIPETVARVARERGAWLVDFRNLIDEACQAEFGHRVPGKEFFLDHVHPTIAGHRMLAVALLERLADVGFVQPREDWRETALPAVMARVESELDAESHAVALRNLAKVLAWAGRHEEAGRLVLSALETIPDDPESHYLAGCYFKHLGDQERAIEHFRIALPHRPDDGEAHRLLAGSLAEAGEWEEARSQFEQARRLLPDDPGLDAQYAVVLSRLGRTREAIVHFRQAVERRPGDADLHYNLGLLLKESGDLSGAETHLAEAVRLAPHDAAARRHLKQLQSGPSEPDPTLDR